MAKLTLEVEGLKTVTVLKIVKLPGKVKSSDRDPRNEYFWTYPDGLEVDEAGPVLRIKKAKANGTYPVDLTIKRGGKDWQTARVDVIIDVPAPTP